MSSVHIRLVEDEAGDLVDLIYYHHEHAPADVAGWPSPEAVDYPVYCGDPTAYPEDEAADCGARIHEVPLTAYGLAEYEAEREAGTDLFSVALGDDGYWPEIL